MSSKTSVRAALAQVAWTGQRDSMLEANITMVRRAAGEGAQIVCLQELAFSPYFCQVQDSAYYAYAETVPGSTTAIMQSVAREHDIVIVAPLYEMEAPGMYYNTAVVIDSDGTLLGKYRKNHIPNLAGFWEKFFFRPGNLGWPVFKTAVGTIGVSICYDRHFPEGWRALALQGAQIIFNPAAAGRGLSDHLWSIEQAGAAVANQVFVGAVNRVGVEPEFGNNDYYGSSYFVDPRGQVVGDIASDSTDDLIVRELDMALLTSCRDTWAFYRDRRPEIYPELTRP